MAGANHPAAVKCHAILSRRQPNRLLQIGHNRISFTYASTCVYSLFHYPSPTPPTHTYRFTRSLTHPKTRNYFTQATNLLPYVPNQTPRPSLFGVPLLVASHTYIWHAPIIPVNSLHHFKHTSRASKITSSTHPL